MSGPALRMPGSTRSFYMNVNEWHRVAKGILTQTLGPWKRPVAHLSKCLVCCSRTSTCMHTTATTALLLKETEKPTTGRSWLSPLLPPLQCSAELLSAGCGMHASPSIEISFLMHPGSVSHLLQRWIQSPSFLTLKNCFLASITSLYRYSRTSWGFLPLKPFLYLPLGGSFVIWVRDCRPAITFNKFG